VSLPVLVVTGSSGFVGRHLLEALKERYRIFGLARRSQSRSGAPVHANITWMHVDIGEREAVWAAFRRIREEASGVETVIHLAAHYDFTGEEHPEYWRTNVLGLRYVLEAARTLAPRRFVFSSSVAASRLPPPGGVLDESSPPDGEHVYARTKRAGEEMLAEYRAFFRPVIVRFAALYSDWCEYPPLFVFLSKWLSRAWDARVLGGRGESAIPYLHVLDLVRFFERLLARPDDVAPDEVLIAGPDGCVSHREIFEEATLLYFGRRARPLCVPRPLCALGLRARVLRARLVGEPPFERPWMARYIDTRMAIDARRTRERLGWSPRERMHLLRRLPFLIEHLKTDPVTWNARNHAAMKRVPLLNNLLVQRLLERHEERIVAEASAALRGPDGARRFPGAQALRPDEQVWDHRVALRHLMNAVRTNDRGVFLAYVRDLAQHRHEQGFEAHEVCEWLRELSRVCIQVLSRDPQAEGLQADLRDHVARTLLQYGCDVTLDVYDAREAPGAAPPAEP
jgi:nucleoside-diphosphate-sugar epimerase